MLKKQSQTCREYAMELEGNIKAYVNVHPLKDNVILEYRREQIRNVIKLTKNTELYEGEDETKEIRCYFNPIG